MTAGYKLATVHRPASVRFAVVSLWLIGPMAGLAHLFTRPSFMNRLQSAEIAGALTGLTLQASIWTAYLLRSKRIKNTFVIRQQAADPPCSEGYPTGSELPSQVRQGKAEAEKLARAGKRVVAKKATITKAILPLSSRPKKQHRLPEIIRNPLGRSSPRVSPCPIRPVHL
jgi:hypothetical protein